MELNQEHKDILNHTKDIAANGNYCGGSKEMDELCEAGLMKYVGTPSWAPDPYYRITGKGKDQMSKAARLRRSNV